jgi:hypothetical protein
VLGRPKVITDRSKVKELKTAGDSLPTIAQEFNGSGRRIRARARITARWINGFIDRAYLNQRV